MFWAKIKLVMLLNTSTVPQVLRGKGKLVEYFGHKIHYDQKKEQKQRMYGAVHVCARDVYPDMVVEFATMSIKIV